MEEEIIPHESKYGIICPIHKEGNMMMCDNYTVVTLLCTTYKNSGKYFICKISTLC